jgi:septum formation protein
MEYKLYLASKSPRRRDLLKQAGVRFQVKVPAKEELPAPKTIQKLKPQNIVRIISESKGLACLEELIREKRQKALVLSADTLVFLNGKVLGKPKSRAHARSMLQELSGNWHWVYTGVTVFRLKDGKIKKKNIHVATKVKFFPLSKNLINWYVSTEEPMDKAGAYGAQGYGATLVERFSGSYTNVVGLPLGETLALIQEISGLKYYD